MKNVILLISLVCLSFLVADVKAQRTYWQQAADYKMEVELNTDNHQFTGKQTIKYTNNSPDTLNKIYYHLFFNAFQPGSEMDERSRTIEDPDRRVMDRIANLADDEIGIQKVTNLKQDKQAVEFEEKGTILIARLAKPLLPGKSTTLTLDFEGQVPLQIRRTGRDNAEGIDYSMAQWYPRLVEYDFQGWHPNPYVGREFHGTWGDFDVTITLDSKYTVAATGILQNADKIGKGYSSKNIEHKTDSKLSWNFKAENVIDFVWAADPEYKHTTYQTPNGPLLRFFYKENSKTKENWELLPELTAKAFQFVNENFGVYPWSEFAVIQGGDGGMEYPMATLITGERNLRSLVGVTVHELLHSWFQGALATNEALHPWIDEGFTVFATDETMAHLFDMEGNPHERTYAVTQAFMESDKVEPLTTHADHYMTNRGYSISSYYKGAVFLNQLRYIIGEENFWYGMRRYFNEWKLKHPTPNDFIRVMEKVSDMELRWYLEYWINTTHVVDYSIEQVVANKDEVVINLRRNQEMFMPQEVLLTFASGRTELHYIPSSLMFGQKPEEYAYDAWIVHPDWTWTHRDYHLKISQSNDQLESIELNPSRKMTNMNSVKNKVNLK
ncbi:MAG: M1 family metallopeptidase [Cyclobacteriaceae bacterium]|nr:M1 family metallopeptidase [Cyclobacteriaceae bacterium]MCH8515266.1 M1 family metallopeptidase [Cyclobacteriaceae bacterium]